MVRQEAREILDGVLLSDGSLVRQTATCNPYFRINLSGTEHYDWVYVIRKAIESLGFEVSPGHPRTYDSRSHGQSYQCLALSTRASASLLGFYKEWYPLGVKEVPPTLSLTPVSLAHLFMGDGCSSWTHSGGYVCVHLSVSGFSVDSVVRLARGLASLGVDHLGYIDRAKNKRCTRAFSADINIHRASQGQFFNLIESYVVPSFQYKIKRFKEAPHANA